MNDVELAANDFVARCLEVSPIMPLPGGWESGLPERDPRTDEWVVRIWKRAGSGVFVVSGHGTTIEQAEAAAQIHLATLLNALATKGIDHG